jgi:hypothetical protein
MTGPAAEAEWRRLAAATSLAELAGRHVDDLTAVSIDDTAWMADLSVPDGWQQWHTPDGLMRLAVHGPRPEGGWDAADTVSVFTFTGVLRPEALSHNADTMLRHLGATGARSYPPGTPPYPGVAAVRASGYITVAGRSLWARFNTYAAGSAEPGAGRLVQHSSFVDAADFRRRGADIATLTDAVAQGFWSSLDTAATPHPHTMPRTSSPRTNTRS